MGPMPETACAEKYNPVYVRGVNSSGTRMMCGTNKHLYTSEHISPGGCRYISCDNLIIGDYSKAGYVYSYLNEIEASC